MENMTGKFFNTSALQSPSAARSPSLLDEFFLVLVRLQLGLLERDLADRFCISESTVSRIYKSWMRLLRLKLEPLINWPHKEQIFDFMPAIFKAKYPDVVVIIDCTEIKMETPSALDNQSACYSYYKSNTTMKGLVGITPSFDAVILTFLASFHFKLLSMFNDCSLVSLSITLI